MSENSKEAAAVFTKAQLLTSRKYADRRDALSALLKDGETYTLDAADKLLSQFMKGRVN